MKCVICGKDAVKTGLCPDCYSEANPLFSLIDKLELKECKCGVFFLRNKWKKYTRAEAVEMYILDNLKVNSDYHKIEVRIRLVRTNQPQVIVKVMGVLGDKKFEQEIKKPIKFDIKQCPGCASQTSNAYQAILQVRVHKDRLHDIMEFIVKDLSKRERVRITKEDVHRHGIDLFFNDSLYTKSLSTRLRNHFGGEVKISESLYSVDHQTSKEIYRINVLFRAFPYEKGSVIVLDGKPLQLNSFSKEVKGEVLTTGQRLSFKYEKNMRIEVLETKKAMICQSYPEVKVLHPETYQPVKVENVDKTDAKDLNVVEWKSRLYSV
jgi:NMD protein affecting ribosome stability and mRNA decay